MQEGQFIPLRRAADDLGVPIAWLRKEANAGTLPSLRAGRRLLFDLDAVRESLRDRQRGQANGHRRARGHAPSASADSHSSTGSGDETVAGERAPRTVARKRSHGGRGR
jgi:hypothetical protein